MSKMAEEKLLLFSTRDSDDEDINVLKINEDYARKYVVWREKEEQQKLIFRYGKDAVDTSSSESDDENGFENELTGKQTKAWYRVFSAVLKKDNVLNDPNFKPFEDESSSHEEDNGNSNSDCHQGKRKSRKLLNEDNPILLKDYEKKFIIERKGLLSDSDDEGCRWDPPAGDFSKGHESLQESAREVFAEVSSDDEDCLLSKRCQPDPERIEAKEEEFIQYLKGKKSKLENEKNRKLATELEPLRDMLISPSLTADERHVWSVIFKGAQPDLKKLEDQDWYLRHKAELEFDVAEEEEDERKYNFRFEEPDKDFIKTHTRNPTDSVRQKVSKRTSKRKEVKARKKEERQRVLDDVRRLKSLKRKEIMTKLDQLYQVAGDTDVNFTSRDIQDDFDPGAYDSMMKEKFDDGYYGVAEDVKPEIPDDLISDDEGSGGIGYDDDESVADNRTDNKKRSSDNQATHSADLAIQQSSELSDTEHYSSNKKLSLSCSKRNSEFRLLMLERRPTFEEVCAKYTGSQHPFGEYLEEYYRLDCEDVVGGDVRCRFPYRNTVPNNYGLTVDEILRCPDRELNTWSSLKKISQIRSDADEEYEVRKFRKPRVLSKKYKILTSLTIPTELDEDAPMRDRENSEGMDETSGTAQHHNGQVPLGAGEKELKDQSMNEKMICETVNSCRKKRKKLTLAANPDSKKLALTANPDNKKKLALTANPHNKKKLALTANPDSKKLALTANPDSKKKLALTANLHNKKLALTTNPDSGKVALTANLDSKEKAPKPLRRRKKDVKTDKRDDIISEETVPANKGRVKGMRGKKRRKDGGRKGYQPIEMITDSRLLALGIDPKKFKYTKHKLSTVKSSSH